MATIENRSVESVLAVYDFHRHPNFAIYQGREPKCDYEGGNMDEGRERLEDYLEMIQASGTGAVYMLRLYPADCKINSKAAYKASTSFVLSEYEPPVRTDKNGIVVVGSGGGNRPGYQDNSMLRQILDSQNRLLEHLIKKEEQAKEDKYDKIIGALMERNEPPPAKDWSDKLMEALGLLTEKPEIITRIAGVFRPAAPPDTQQIFVNTPIAGTNQQQEDIMENHSQTQGAEPDGEAMDALNDRLDTALDQLEEKIGLEKLTQALEALAAMNKMKLQGLLHMI